MLLRIITFGTFIIENVSISDSLSGGIQISRSGFVSNITLKNVVVSNCSTINGGGIMISDSNSNMTFINTTLDNNKAAVNGGGLYIGKNNSFITIVNSVFKNNVAKESGGGLYM